MQVIYLVREVWRGVSARADWHVLPGGDMGTKRSLADLTLTRSASARVNLPTHACAQGQGPLAVALQQQ